MDATQEAYAAFIRREVQENANPYPTAIQAFRAGIDSERERIIALLEERGWPEHDDEVVICEPLDSVIALIKGENK